MLLKTFIFFIFIFFAGEFSCPAQLSYAEKENIDISDLEISNIAYKLPYRGDNYKFYGTLSFHVLGKAFVNNKVYNSFVEAQHLSKKNISNVQFRILKCSRKKFGYLNPYNHKICGNKIVFMIPMKKNGKPVKFYYRTGLFRLFLRFSENGTAKRFTSLKIDFETTAKYLINLDDAARFYGLQIKTVIIKRAFINRLYETSSGKELRKRNVRFVKYLSRKINRRYEEIFSVEFEKMR